MCVCVCVRACVLLFLQLSRLKCRLEPTWPGSKLSFHKMEMLRRKPPIVAFHDVISRNDASEIVNISEEQVCQTGRVEWGLCNHCLVLVYRQHQEACCCCWWWCVCACVCVHACVRVCACVYV